MKNKKTNGFTLIELSIVTIIVGILLAAIIYPYSVWQQKRSHQVSVDNVDQMAWGVSAFRVVNGHYPCPAPMDIDRNDPNYGRSTDCSDNTTTSVGTCASGYCVASGRNITDVDSDGNGILDAADAFTTRVRIGTIPFREINLPEEQAYDSYGNRIVYAVTETLAYSESGGLKNHKNDPSAGGIDIVYEDGGTTYSRLDIAGSGNYVVLSHGRDKMGGINHSGNNNGIECNEASPDGENCDFINDSDGPTVNNIFYSSERATTGDNNHHDDLVLYQTPLNKPKWARATNNPSNIYSIPSEENPDGRVGSDYLYNYYKELSKITNPVEYATVYENARLWVGGNILIENDTALPAGSTGQVQTRRICDRNGENCFPASAIGGAGTKCRTTDGVFLQGVKRDDLGTATDISDDEIIGDCQNIITYKCDTGEYLKAVNADGSLDCRKRPCPQKTVYSCSQSFVLPQANVGETRSFSAGNQYKCSKGNFLCNNDSQWEGSFDNNLCSCSPGTVPRTSNCKSGCTGGPITYNEVTNCNSCKITHTNKVDNCNCPPTPPTGCTLSPKCLCTNSCPPTDTCPPCTPGTSGGGACPAGFSGQLAKYITVCGPYPSCTQTTTIPATCTNDSGPQEPPCKGGTGPGCP